MSLIQNRNKNKINNLIKIIEKTQIPNVCTCILQNPEIIKLIIFNLQTQNTRNKKVNEIKKKQQRQNPTIEAKKQLKQIK